MSCRNKAFFLFSLGVLWVPLLWHLSEQWSVFEQYRYGYAVPFVCLLLLLLRWGHHAEAARVFNVRASPGGACDGRLQHPSAGRGLGGSELRRYGGIALGLAAILLLLLLPTRLIHEANPLWRLTSWVWAGTLVVVTLCLVYFIGGRVWVGLFSFPVGFVLVAVPWPSPLENRVVQGLARANACATVEVLGFVGAPVLPRGNAIEVARGVVGLEEACSGIRSLQATLMISLFLGEYFRLSLTRRALFVVCGFALAFLFNVGRTTLLTWVAVRRGVEALAIWHGSTGSSVALLCFFSLAAVALVMRPQCLKERWQELKAGKLPEKHAGDGHLTEHG